MKKSSSSHIAAYRRERARLLEFGGAAGEINLRPAFAACLSAYCRARGDLALVPELESGKGKRPDGTVRDKMRLDYGHWEAKGETANLDREIARKRERGYPTGNILFENGKVAVLIQNGAEVMRADMENDSELDRIICAFLSHRPRVIEDFHKAVKQFRADLPAILAALREMIEKAHTRNPGFAKKAAEFLEVCRRTINPDIVMADVREMLIQHILTRDIFLRVFDEENFHRQNSVARHLEELQDGFMTSKERQEMLGRIKHYYAAIARAAQSIGSHREKQNFLKVLYENFYQTYNPKAADRMGVVYTPGEIVRFMVRAADDLTHRWFGRRLYDRNVKILDPATGTGTFIAEMVDFFPMRHLARKYANELYANEAGILPYYIANLNIEHAYMAKTGEYMKFPGICFVDTLDNTDFEGGRGQAKFLGWSRENIQRIKLQNEQDISVIIGNPPYNANQKNENENNKNREYPEIDARIKETYINAGTAQKTKLYDMYVRFIRWASDRLGDNGVLAFVSNSSFIDARSYDGFRKIIAEEFNELWIVNMKGAIRGVAGDRKKDEGENIFGVQVGIAVWFFVKKSGRAGSDIFYRAAPGGSSAAGKFAFLAQMDTLDKDDFTHIVPDEKHNWINQTKNGFGKLIPIADKGQKLSRAPVKDAVFKMVSLGVVTSRDDWVYDFDRRNLAAKAKFFCDFYAEEQARLSGDLDRGAGGVTYKKIMEWKKTGKTPLADWVRRDIKWTSELEAHLSKGSALKYDENNIIDSSYRPFVNKKTYYGKIITHRQYQMPKIFPDGKTGENKVICFTESLRINFSVFAARNMPSLALFTEPAQCVSLYCYTEKGNKVSNISEWALNKFRGYYKSPKISAEDIFNYVYAVLHNPAYRKKYRRELMREFPRLPFYGNFPKWAAWGKKLMHLHINYAEVKPCKLARADDNAVKQPLPKLKADKYGGKIVVDTKTVLSGVPAAAWEYRLGKYSALEWVLDQYKEKKIKDATVAAKFNNYKFSDYKEEVIDLLERVAAVSAETVKITKEMERENNG